MRPSPEVEWLLPGEQDVAFYEEHGYYVTPKVLPDDVIDAAIRGAERHWAGGRDWRLPVSTGVGGPDALSAKLFTTGAADEEGLAAALLPRR